MAALSIRDLDDEVREKLRVRAARHGRSMEAEVRCILAEAVEEPPGEGSLFDVLSDRFGALGGVDLELPARLTNARSADLPE
jgi:plasmid stability protein